MKREFLIQVFFVALVSLGIGYLYMFSGQTKFQESKLRVEKEIAKIYSDFDKVTQEKDLELATIDIARFKEINKELSFDLYIYKNDELVFWNENKAVPDLNINTLTEEAKLITLKNGYYIALKKTVGDNQYVALSLLRNSYSLVNKYLNNSFSKQFCFVDSDIILPSQHSTGEKITSPNGNTIFRILHLEDQQSSIIGFRLLISTVVIVFLYFLLVTWVYKIESRYGFSVSLMAAFVFGVFWLSAILFIPFEFKKFLIFDSQIYGSGIFNSLGELMAYLILFLGWSYYILFYILRNKIKENILLKIVFGILVILSFVIANIILRGLVLDSIINYDAKNLTLLNPYAIFGLFLALIVSVISLFNSISFVNLLKNDRNFKWIIIVVSIPVLLLLYFYGFKNLSIGLTLLLLLYNLFLYNYILESLHTNVILIIVVSVFFSVIQVSSLFRVYTIEKNETIKKTIAFKKARLRDVAAEDHFSKIERKILDDAFVKSFFQNPMISFKDIHKRMTFRYFGGYYSKYDVTILPFNIEGKPIKVNSNESLVEYYELINKFGMPTINKNLSFVQNNKNQYSYLSLLKIADGDKVLGTLALKISPKTYNIGNVYPELLLEDKNDLINQYSEDIEYAIYYNNVLTDRSDDFAYLTILPENTPSEYTKEGYNHFVFEIDEFKKIIISSKEETFFDKFSVFSFVLCIYFLMGFFITIFYFKFTNRLNKDVFNFSFRKRINIAMLSLVILSFLTIGMATVSYFSTQYNGYHQKKLLRKQKSILSSIKYLIEKNDLQDEKRFENFLLNSFSSDLIEISDVHKMDINIFDLKGKLIISSQDGIFTSGLLSQVMNPDAFVLLNSEQKSLVSQDESIGNLDYLSIYVPIFNVKGEKMAFLNIPYFAKEKNLSQDISNFMISLVNVYVLLLMIASIVAFFVSNSITNPLKIISEKLKDISLTKGNAIIEWKSDDEIGALVKEYNRMIFQLDESAKLLASTERDMAWREMAKQIAHEIKNPLTPMKLSIQHLQRALKDDKERGAELAERMSKTLIEQIDNLSDIATAFASFAKMPKGDRIEIDLIEIVNAVLDLFDGDNISLQKNFSVSSALIIADRNQMISVFNNLVKNGIQAMEEVEKKKLEIDISTDENFYLISIKDFGVGISNDEKSKVFVPNFTTKSSGTGLGLAISKQIISGIGGYIWFESEENNYTIFYLKIPMSS